MADAVPNDRLRQYLRDLKPEARALLVAELERATLSGEGPPGAALILDALRDETRKAGRSFPRVGSPQRLFFVPVEPFLVDDIPERKHRGRISRVCLGPMWDWISRDLMPEETKTYVDQVNVLLAANEKGGAEQLARAFQDLAEQRMREVLGAVRTDEKLHGRLAAQVGTPHAIEDVREIAAILRVRDALDVIASRLPATISNLADEQLENVSALLELPVGRHRDVFLYALLVVMTRLGSPWQLIRLAVHAAKSDVASRVVGTPFAVAVDVVLTDVERMISTLRRGLKAGRGEEVVGLLKDIHDAARALRTEMDLASDSPWARQLAASRGEVAKLLQAEIDNLPGQVRRLLRARTARDVGADATIDAHDVADIDAKLMLVAGCRNYASELADQRGDAARHVRSAELFRLRHADTARSVAHIPARRTELSPVAGRCGGEVLRQAVRRRLCGCARQGRRCGRERRTKGRESLVSR